MSRKTRFLDVLHELSGGRTLSRLDTALAEVIDQAQALQQKGSITLKIDIQPMGEDVVRFEDGITVKEPQPKKMATNFFITDEGIQRRDPRQADVEDFTTKGSIREVK